MGSETNWDGLFGRSGGHQMVAKALLIRSQNICAMLDQQFVATCEDVSELLGPNVDEQVVSDFLSDLESAFEQLNSSASALSTTISRALRWHNAQPVATNADLARRIDILEDTLDRCAEFIDGQVDVVDGDYGEPEPNKAMRLMSAIRDVLPA